MVIFLTELLLEYLCLQSLSEGRAAATREFLGHHTHQPPEWLKGLVTI